MYEDDFAYHVLIHPLANDADAVALHAAIDAYERTLDGKPSDRLAVCLALSEGDATALDTAFEVMVTAHAQQMAEERPKNEDRPPFEPRSRLYVEGLALLRLAEQRRIGPLKAEYPPQCPSIARVEPYESRPEDIFSQL